MAERAGIFDQSDDFDLSAFTAKKPTVKSAPEPRAEAVREVSEQAKFRSREPAPAAPKAPKATLKERRQHRTGRNVQLNMKVDAETHKLFYEITDSQKWVSGETMKRALAALQKELTAAK
jgi:hypothetical protein